MSLKNNLQNNDNNGSKEHESGDPFQNKLRNGGFGLTKTFWLYWFLPVLALEILDPIINEHHVSRILQYSILALSFFIIPCIKNTTGKKAWRIMAILFVIFYLILDAFALYLFPF